MLQYLTDAVKALEEKQFRGLILQSNLSTVFSAGLDINELHNTSEKRLFDYLTEFLNLWKTFYLSPLVTIAAINGHALAGGCVIALSCDQRIMAQSTKSRIGLTEVLLGFCPPKWICHAVMNVIGIRKGEEAIMTGKSFTPKEALTLGLVDKLVPPSELLSAVDEEMDLRLKVPEPALKTTKKILRQPFIDAISTYQKADIEERVKVFLSNETQKCIKDYLDGLKKR